jgi:hypothetical protein
VSGGPSSIQKGLDYQARWFWLWAAKLLWPNPGYSRVWYEYGPGGLDDVGFRRIQPFADRKGHRRGLERHQVKFQVRLDRPLQTGDFIDPEAMGGTTISFLEKARDAYLADRKAGDDPVLSLVTDRQIDKDEWLGTDLFDPGSSHLDVARLLRPSRGLVYNVRRSWQDKVELDDAQFEDLLECLTIRPSRGSFRELDEELDMAFRLAQMRPIADWKLTRAHDDLIRKLSQQGEREFDAARLHAILDTEGLLQPPEEPDPARRAGVRSFVRFAEDLPTQVDVIADFVPHFEWRHIADPALWRSEVVPDLNEWAAAIAAQRLETPWELRLDCSPSLAVAAGNALPAASGVTPRIVQKGQAGVTIWTITEPSRDLDLDRTRDGDSTTEAAIVVAITRDIAIEAAAYLREQVPAVGEIVVIAATPPSQTVLRDGADAVCVADTVLAELDRLKAAGSKRTHLLPAAPNAVMFAIGRGLRGRGVVTIYDYDLEGYRDGTYEEGITLPVRPAAGSEGN